MDILKLLNIPLIQPSRIPITKINEILETDNQTKRFTENHVSSIKLVSILNEDTIKIRSYVDDNYSFQTIYVLEVELKSEESISEVARLIHSAFPESTLIVLNHKEQSYLSGALKRINRLDQTKTVIEDCVTTLITSEYNNLNLKISVLNLKGLYDYILNTLYKHKAYVITGIIPKSNIDYKKAIKEYEEASSNISRLKKEYNEASMMAEKAKIDDELYKYENLLNEVICEIRGE